MSRQLNDYFMNIELFIENYKNAFGNYELPIAFWYSDESSYKPEKTKGCIISILKSAREGKIVSLSKDTIACPGAKLYAGYVKPPPFLGSFISEKERYKESPELAEEFMNDLSIPSKTDKYINFVSINKIESFEKVEGLIFFATPDVLSGLVSWVLYDTNNSDAVTVPFGSGCSSIVAQVVLENQNEGQRTFLGMFDPSARPHVESNILTLAIPMSRFKKLYHTFESSCLQGTKDWNKVKQRIENGI